MDDENITVPNTGSENSPVPDPRAVAEVVDHISRSVEYARELRSHIIKVIGIDLNVIRLLSAWEDPVPGAGDWRAVAERALEIAKNVRWTPPPLGSRVGPEDVQALRTFIKAIPTLMPAIEALRTAAAPLERRIAARGIRATFDCGAKEAVVLDQVHRATGIPRGMLAWGRRNWLEAAWEAMRSGAWVRASKNLKAYLNKAIRMNKQHLDVEYGEPGKLGTQDLDGLEVDKRAAKRLEPNKSWRRRERVDHPDLTPVIEDEDALRPVMELDAEYANSQWHQIELGGEDLLIAIEQTRQRMEVVDKFRRDEATQKELEYLAAFFNGAETPKEVLAAVGKEANRSEYQSLQRKLARRRDRD